MKIVDKAMQLPVVSDAYEEVSKLARPLSPCIEAIQNVAESGLNSIKTKAEENILPQLSEGTTAKLDSAKDKLASAYENLDSLACDGIDRLTNKIPALKEATPVLLESTKETAVAYYGYATEYAASFTISQMYLKLGDKGLQLVTDVVNFTGLEQTKPVKPVMDGIKTLRRNARAIRRAGAKLVESKPVKTIGEASILGAVAEIFCFNFFLSVVGLQLVPANILENPATAELDSSHEDLEAKLSEERIDGYVSDEDPDFVPNEADEDSSEDEKENSDDDKDSSEDENEKSEDDVDVKEKDGLFHKIKDAVGEVVDTIEDVLDEAIDSSSDDEEIEVVDVADDLE